LGGKKRARWREVPWGKKGFVGGKTMGEKAEETWAIMEVPGQFLVTAGGEKKKKKHQDAR